MSIKLLQCHKPNCKSNFFDLVYFTCYPTIEEATEKEYRKKSPPLFSINGKMNLNSWPLRKVNIDKSEILQCHLVKEQNSSGLTQTSLSKLSSIFSRIQATSKSSLGDGSSGTMECGICGNKRRKKMKTGR